MHLNLSIITFQSPFRTTSIRKQISASCKLRQSAPRDNAGEVKSSAEGNMVEIVEEIGLCETKVHEDLGLVLGLRSTKFE